MKDCPRYPTCSASLCPQDLDLSKRSWMVGEDVCKNKNYRDEPWLKRQKKLNRTAPATLQDQPLALDYLTRTAPKKRTLSPEHKQKLMAALQQYQREKEAVLEG